MAALLRRMTKAKKSVIVVDQSGEALYPVGMMNTNKVRGPPVTAHSYCRAEHLCVVKV